MSDAAKPGILRRLNRVEQVIQSIVWGLALVATAAVTALTQAFVGKGA
jgi:hypothetical protein